MSRGRCSSILEVHVQLQSIMDSRPGDASGRLPGVGGPLSSRSLGAALALVNSTLTFPVPGVPSQSILVCCAATGAAEVLRCMCRYGDRQVPSLNAFIRGLRSFSEWNLKVLVCQRVSTF